MHAVVRIGPRRWGLLLMLLAPLAVSTAVMAGLSEFAAQPARGVSQSIAVPAAAPEPPTTAELEAERQAATAAGAAASPAVPAAAVRVGQPAPELSLPSLRTHQQDLTLSDYRGKVVYLDFWSAWCAPCRRTMPELDRLRREHSRADFEVLGVNLDPDSAPGRRLLEQLAVGYPSAVDSGGASAAQFGVAVLPALVVVDRAGIVRDVRQGPEAGAVADLRNRLASLIEERDIR